MRTRYLLGVIAVLLLILAIWLVPMALGAAGGSSGDQGSTGQTSVQSPRARSVRSCRPIRGLTRTLRVAAPNTRAGRARGHLLLRGAHWRHRCGRGRLCRTCVPVCMGRAGGNGRSLRRRQPAGSHIDARKRCPLVGPRHAEYAGSTRVLMRPWFAVVVLLVVLSIWAVTVSLTVKVLRRQYPPNPCDDRSPSESATRAARGSLTDVCG